MGPRANRLPTGITRVHPHTRHPLRTPAELAACPNWVWRVRVKRRGVGEFDNVAKHAHAGAVWITVTRQNRMTTMEVRDNGRGITDAQIKSRRTMGLLGMRERTQAIGGGLRVSRAARGGTRLVVVLPDGDTRRA